MSRFLVISILVTVILLIIACGITPTPTPNPLFLESLKLTTHAEPATFTGPDQIIGYTYTISYSGTTALDGPATVTDTKITILCPPMNTIGNKNDKLDGTEEITCAGAYKTTAADVTAGLISSTATAHVGGQDSN